MSQLHQIVRSKMMIFGVVFLLAYSGVMIILK